MSDLSIFRVFSAFSPRQTATIRPAVHCGKLAVSGFHHVFGWTSEAVVAHVGTAANRFLVDIFFLSFLHFGFVHLPPGMEAAHCAECRLSESRTFVVLFEFRAVWASCSRESSQ